MNDPEADNDENNNNESRSERLNASRNQHIDDEEAEKNKSCC